MNIKWYKRFLDLALHISEWSKDPSSKVGAVITEGNRIVSLGYNGFAAGVEDNDHRLNNRDIKLNLTIHAEENAMIFAKQDISGCTIYLTHPPCPRCASKLIQEGIRLIVYREPTEDFLSRWEKDINLSKKICEEAGVTMLCYHLTK
jgi:dCMP deaminase